MGVDRHGGLDVGVAKEAAGGINVHAGLIEQGGVAVAQDVGRQGHLVIRVGISVPLGADSGLCGLGDEAHLLAIVHPAAAISTLRERESGILAVEDEMLRLVGGELPQRLLQIRQERDRADAGGSLGAADLGLAGAETHGAGDGDGAGLEIYVPPADRQRLAAAQAALKAKAEK